MHDKLKPKMQNGCFIKITKNYEDGLGCGI